MHPTQNTHEICTLELLRIKCSLWATLTIFGKATWQWVAFGVNKDGEYVVAKSAEFSAHWEDPDQTLNGNTASKAAKTQLIAALLGNGWQPLNGTNQFQRLG